MSEPIARYDCQACGACGACCISPSGSRASYVSLTRSEGETMKRLGLPVVSGRRGITVVREFLELGVIPLPRGMGGKACVAFTGTVGGACSCSIYADRPQACCLFEPGSIQCLLARDEAGLPRNGEGST